MAVVTAAEMAAALRSLAGQVERFGSSGTSPSFDVFAESPEEFAAWLGVLGEATREEFPAFSTAGGRVGGVRIVVFVGHEVLGGIPAAVQSPEWPEPKVVEP